MFDYTWSQFIALFIGLIIILSFSFTYRHFTKNKSEKIREIPLMVIAVLVVVLEILKLIHNYKINNLFDSLPLHFCHMYLLWLPLSVFTKGKFKHALQCVSVITCLYMAILLYIFPSTIIAHSELYLLSDFGSFHNFIIHQLYVLFPIFSIVNNIYKPEKHDYIYTMLAIIFYACIGIPGALITKYNYALLLQSRISFIDNFFAEVGHALYLICYFILMMIVAYVTTYGYYSIYHSISKRKLKKANLTPLIDNKKDN